MIWSISSARLPTRSCASSRPSRRASTSHGAPSDARGPSCLSDANRDCYRAQCFATARLLADRLHLDDWSVSFQSRLGRTPWIRPYTDLVLPELARAGKKRVVVFSAAFVADCLETLEEIGIRGRDSFRAAGGEELVLVPSLNSDPAWVDAAEALVRRAGA